MKKENQQKPKFQTKKEKYFVGFLYDDKSKKKLQRLINKLQLKNSTHINRIHTTIFNDVPTKNKQKAGELFKYNRPEKVNVVGKKLRIADYKKKKVLLLDIDCKECVRLQNIINKKYRGFIYKKYTPHITLSYDYQKPTIPKSEGLDKLKLRTKQLIVAKN